MRTHLLVNHQEFIPDAAPGDAGDDTASADPRDLEWQPAMMDQSSWLDGRGWPSAAKCDEASDAASAPLAQPGWCGTVQH